MRITFAIGCVCHPDGVGHDEPDATALERARDILAAVPDEVAFVEAATGGRPAPFCL